MSGSRACEYVDFSIQERGRMWLYALQKAYGKDTLSVKEEGTDHDRDAEGLKTSSVCLSSLCP